MSTSIVVPCRNEAENILPLVAGIAQAMGPTGLFEIIVVDDGSSDGTAALLLAQMGTSPMLRVLRHDRPGGQSAAIHSGVRAALFDLICTLDGDGQNPPEELPGLIAPFAFGAALAFGVLAKGPVILVHLMPLALTRPLWSMSPEPGRAKDWYGRIALAVGAALVFLSIWLVPALSLGGPEYRAEVLWRQSAGRMVNAFDHARPVWFFIAVLPVLLWPWAWRPVALRGLAHRGLWQDRRARLLAIWGFSTLVLFSLISGKQVHYLIPALPAAALALAAAPPPRRFWGPVLACLALVVPVLIWAGLLATGRVQLDGADVMTLGPMTLVLSGLLAVAGLGAIVLATRRAPVLGWALVTPVALLVMHISLRPAVTEHYDTSRFAAELARTPGAGVAIEGYPYQGEFGFTARLSTPIEVLAAEDLDAWIAGHPQGLLVSTNDLPILTPPVGEAWLNGKRLRLFRLP